MKKALLLITGLITINLTAQVANRAGGNTYAIVVGISDYQNPSIPDLQYAHKDAQEFAKFLQSESGSNVSVENIRILLNEKATYGQIISGLDWLLEVSEKGDKVIVYFSGHGDVETKTRSQLGFLLAWDSPPRSYMAGALPLFYLKEIIQTISIEKKAKVLMVADACRSGSLAGAQVGGSQLTTANLSLQFANEIKILSCQANEYSIEGDQWGGGRGVFSYHLMNGLFGKADNNEDGAVNLKEIGRYLEDHVTADVDPHNQSPITFGNRLEHLSYIFEDALTLVEEPVNSNAENSTPARTRSPNKENTTNKLAIEQLGATHPLYQEFKKAIEEGIFLEPVDACASAYYDQLKKDPSLAPLYTTMQRDFAAALHDEVQQAINALLESDPFEVNNLVFHPERYGSYPNYLQKNIDLLGKDHYSIPALTAKKNFFEAINKQIVLADQDNVSKRSRDSLNGLALQLLDEAILLLPDAAYLYYGKSLFYSDQIPSKIDSILVYSNKALKYSPRWLLPYLTVGEEYFYQLREFTKAEEWLLKAYEINPESYVVIERLCWLYQNMDRLEEAMVFAKKLMELRPDLFNSYGNIGGVHLMLKNYPEAEKWYKQSLEIENSPSSFSNLFLGQIYFATRREELGIAHYDKLINDDSTLRWIKGYLYSWKGVALVNFTTEFEEARIALEESIERMGLPSQKAEGYVLMAKAKVIQEQWEEAEVLLEKAFSLDTLSGPIILGYALMAEIKNQNGQITEAEFWFKKSLALTSGIYVFDLNYREKALFRYGSFLLKQNRPDEAEQLFRESNKYTHETGYYGYYGLALLAAHRGDESLMYKQLEFALDKWLPLPQLLLPNQILDKYGEAERFKTLVKKHFPEY